MSELFSKPGSFFRANLPALNGWHPVHWFQKQLFPIRKSTLEVLPFFQLKLILVINRIDGLAISFQGCIYKWVESSTLQNGNPSDIPCLGNLHRSFAFCWPQSHAEYDAISVAEDVKHMLLTFFKEHWTCSKRNHIVRKYLSLRSWNHELWIYVSLSVDFLQSEFASSFSKKMHRIAVKMIGWSIC